MKSGQRGTTHALTMHVPHATTLLERAHAATQPVRATANTRLTTSVEPVVSPVEPALEKPVAGYAARLVKHRDAVGARRQTKATSTLGTSKPVGTEMFEPTSVGEPNLPAHARSSTRGRCCCRIHRLLAAASAPPSPTPISRTRTSEAPERHRCLLQKRSVHEAGRLSRSCRADQPARTFTETNIDGRGSAGPR